MLIHVATRNLVFTEKRVRMVFYIICTYMNIYLMIKINANLNAIVFDAPIY